MIKWLHLSLIIVAAILILLLLVILIKQRGFFNFKTRKTMVVSDAERGQTFQNGITRLHQVSPHHHHHNNSNNRESSNFNWNDHPSLITDAVENGWTQFGFTTFISSLPSVKPTLFGVCASVDQINEINVEINWEVFENSSDFMQKIRLNPGIKKNFGLSLIRTALPLPGPCLDNSSFPQEAYFEITILPLTTGKDQFLVDVDEKEKLESDKIKLIGQDLNGDISIDSSSGGVIISNRSQRKNKILVDEFRKKEAKNKEANIPLMCIGLSGGGSASMPLKLPGSYQGSIGFNSTGSVYLEGTRLAVDSDKYEWGRIDKVIGCGYNPRQKKVFLTVDSFLVHEIECKTEEFGFPLYPILAASSDVMVLVNLGQGPFKYGPANMERSSNPCFVGNSNAFGNEDSKELFSMGRIDAQWFQRSAARSNNNTVNSIRDLEYDQESESDFFEIVLDNSVRSPHTNTTGTGYQ